jgi:hypothetical protein
MYSPQVMQNRHAKKATAARFALAVFHFPLF